MQSCYPASSLQFQVVPSGHLRFQSVALKALQEAAEAFLVTLFEDRFVKIDIQYMTAPL